MKRVVLFTIIAITLLCQISSAQTQQVQPEGGGATTSFSYQGSLKISGAPANGNYDFEFRFFDAPTGGTQVGFTITQNNLAVTNGIFRAVLDTIGSLPPTSNVGIHLEIRVRQTGGGAYTVLTPREVLLSVPYAMRSLDSERLGGVDPSQYITTTTGGANFIQNSNSQQTGNFNISGFGTANVLRAVTQFDIGVSHALSMPGTDNIFAGQGAGQANTTGTGNSFFGRGAGFANTLGNDNSFFGRGAGANNMTGGNNSYFGIESGSQSTTASNNSFFGRGAGFASTGAGNTFVGALAGDTNTSGLANTLIGNLSDVGSTGLTNATAIGANSLVTSSNSLILGGINGVNGASGGTNVGIGTTAPGYKLHVVGENIRVEGNTTSIFPRFSLNFTGGGTDAKRWQNYASTDRLRFTALNDAENTENIWLDVVRSGLSVTGVNFLSGVVSINQLGAAGATALCRNASNQISTCSSSARYKKDVASYTPGLSLIKQLRPVSFNWKSGGMADLGLVAEEVADIEPLLTTTNDKGEVEGVKYDRIGVIAVNAIKEQQAEISGQRSVIRGQQRQIEDLSSQVKDQQKQIDALKKLVCAQNPTAEICMEEK